jgi:hypothetical protein
MGAPESSPRGWRPAFLDYLYVAFTNASAFSPRCDAPQRSHQDPHADRVNRVILTVGLVAARAVNILNM